MLESHSNYKTIAFLTISTMLLSFIIVTNKFDSLDTTINQNEQIATLSGEVKNVYYSSGLDMNRIHNCTIINFTDGRTNIFPFTITQVTSGKYNEIDYYKSSGIITEIRVYDP